MCFYFLFCFVLFCLFCQIFSKLQYVIHTNHISHLCTIYAPKVRGAVSWIGESWKLTYGKGSLQSCWYMRGWWNSMIPIAYNRNSWRDVYLLLGIPYLPKKSSENCMFLWFLVKNRFLVCIVNISKKWMARLHYNVKMTS